MESALFVLALGGAPAPVAATEDFALVMAIESGIVLLGLGFLQSIVAVEG